MLITRLESNTLSPQFYCLLDGFKEYSIILYNKSLKNEIKKDSLDIANHWYELNSSEPDKIKNKVIENLSTLYRDKSPATLFSSLFPKPGRILS